MKTLYKASILLLCIFTYTNSYSQKTAEQLGEFFVSAIQEENADNLNALIPESAILLAFSKRIGMNKSESEIDEFNQKYAGRVDKFLSQIEEMKAKGVEEFGINWQEIQYESTLVKTRELNPLNQKKPVKVKDLTVIFKYANESYKVKLRSVFDYKKMWYLGGEKPLLYDM